MGVKGIFCLRPASFQALRETVGMEYLLLVRLGVNYNPAFLSLASEPPWFQRFSAFGKDTRAARRGQGETQWQN